MIVAVHSAHFIRRRAIGDAHKVPGTHARFSSPRSTTKPKPSASTVPATKYGRSGSNVAASPAPLRPNATATSGPAQHSVDTTAATTPPVAASAVLVTDVVMDPLLDDLDLLSGFCARRDRRQRRPRPDRWSASFLSSP